MAAPTVIAARCIGRECPAKVAAGESGDALGEASIAVRWHKANLVHRSLKCIHALAQLSEKISVRAGQGGTVSGKISLASVEIVATDRTEEDLPLHAEAAIGYGARTCLD